MKDKKTKPQHVKKNHFSNVIKSCIFIVKTVKNTQITLFKKISLGFQEQYQRKIKMCYLFD